MHTTKRRHRQVQEKSIYNVACSCTYSLCWNILSPAVLLNLSYAWKINSGRSTNLCLPWWCPSNLSKGPSERVPRIFQILSSISSRSSELSLSGVTLTQGFHWHTKPHCSSCLRRSFTDRKQQLKICSPALMPRRAREKVGMSKPTRIQLAQRHFNLLATPWKKKDHDTYLWLILYIILAYSHIPNSGFTSTISVIRPCNSIQMWTRRKAIRQTRVRVDVLLRHCTQCRYQCKEYFFVQTTSVGLNGGGGPQTIPKYVNLLDCLPWPLYG